MILTHHECLINHFPNCVNNILSLVDLCRNCLRRLKKQLAEKDAKYKELQDESAMCH